MSTNFRKSDTITLLHEFWCCKKEFNAFVLAGVALYNRDQDTELRLTAFSSYGNFIRHLYSFYEGIIILRNPELIKGLKKNEVGLKISELLYQEVRKLIRNKVAFYDHRTDLDKREIQHLTKSEVPLAFGTDFRQVRNRFSHVIAKRVTKHDITLNDFFNFYHCYILLLFENCNFTWQVDTSKQYDWEEINQFMR